MSPLYGTSVKFSGSISIRSIYSFHVRFALATARDVLDKSENKPPKEFRRGSLLTFICHAILLREGEEHQRN